MGLSLMPENKIENRYFISRPALLSIKSELALTKAGLLGENVAENAQVVLDAISEFYGSGQVEVINSYKDIFDTSKKRNREIIWAMSYYLNKGLSTTPLPSRMYISAIRYAQIAAAVTGDNKDEAYITFETGSFATGAAQTGNCYNTWARALKKSF